MRLLNKERRILEAIMGLLSDTREQDKIKCLKEIKTRMRVAERATHKKEFERLYCND